MGLFDTFASWIGGGGLLNRVHDNNALFSENPPISGFFRCFECACDSGPDDGGVGVICAAFATLLGLEQSA